MTIGTRPPGAASADAGDLPGAGGEHVVQGICGVCDAACGVEIVMDGERLVRLRPWKGHPKGIVCTRGTRAPEVIYAPERLRYPQRRVGERGEGRFERITWDDAMEIMTSEIRRIGAQHGPEAMAMYTGRGNFEFGLNEMFAPAGPPESSANAVLFPFGSPNATGVGSLCFVSYGMIAPKSCFGAMVHDITDEIELADLVFVWGVNPATASPPENLVRLKEAQARGARVVVIDHRRTETARALGCQWVGVRPGTDGALALGMIAVLVAEERYDRDFVERWTHGFEELRAYAATFTPERVEQITGVPAATVVELARAIGDARAYATLMYTGLEYSNSGVQAIRATLALQALAGSIDIPGGKVIRTPGGVDTTRNTTPAPVGARPAVGAREHPVYWEIRQEAHGGLLPKAILEDDPYPVRGMIISGASVITSWPNPGLWRRAFERLEFLAVLNRFPTADAAYADLLLPATTMFEIESYQTYGSRVQLRRRVIPPQGEARNDYLVWAELASRLGYGHLWPQTERAMVERALEGTGISYEELAAHPEGVEMPRPPVRYRKHETGHLRADGQPGFETPTGKFEFTSEWLRSHGYDALSVYTEPSEGPLAAPELARQFPLVFNSGARVRSDFRSQHRTTPSLLAMAPRPTVQLHPRDALARGISDGDEVDVVSPRGRVRFWAAVTEDIVAGAVEAAFGGGGPLGPAEWQGSNVNELTDEANVDPISGFPVYRALLCDVVRIGPAA